MTQAGWYPDPAGQPQTYRYWDGSSWSQVTTSNPYSPPPTGPTGPPPGPPPAAPQQPTPPYGGGQPYAPAPSPYGGYPGAPGGPTGSGGSGTGKTIALVVLALVLIIGLGVGAFFGVMALRDDDETGAGGEDPTTGATEATPDETESSGATSGPSDWANPTGLQCTGGVPEPSVAPPNGATRVSGGGLSIPVPKGYPPDVSYAPAFTFADGFTPLQKVVIKNQWVSIYGVGALRKANGFESPEQAAEVVMTCMAQSPNLYNGFSGRTDLSSEPIEIDGHDAHQVISDIEVDDPEIDVDGDRAQVIVVDTGDEESFGVYITVVPLGNDRLIAQQEAMVEEIRVE